MNNLRILICSILLVNSVIAESKIEGFKNKIKNQAKQTSKWIKNHKGTVAASAAALVATGLYARGLYKLKTPSTMGQDKFMTPANKLRNCNWIETLKLPMLVGLAELIAYPNEFNVRAYEKPNCIILRLATHQKNLTDLNPDALEISTGK